MLDKARPLVNPILELIARPFLWVHPNLVTLIGFVAGILVMILLSEGEYGYALLAFSGVLLDGLDGTIARMNGRESKFGAFFDATLDRLTDAFIMCGFALADLVSWPLVTATVIASFMISYIRSKAEQLAGNKTRLAVGIIERPERIMILFLSVLMLAIGLYRGHGLYLIPNELGLNNYEILFSFLLVLSVITILQRLYAAWSALKTS